jgi:hypothetical protein
MKSQKAALVIFVVIILSFLSFAPYVKTAKAQSDYDIKYVNHAIQFLYNGYIFINDTIQINGTVSDGFLIGFPAKYGASVLRCVAYNSTNNFDVSLNVPLENRIGFYGVKVSFPPVTPQNFSVGFVLSNNLLTQSATNSSIFALDFPAYPSLTKPAAVCNSSIVLKNAVYINGTVEALEYSFSGGSLPQFTYQPANVTFQMTDSEFELFDVKEFRQEFNIGGAGGVEGQDNYQIKSKSPATITSFEVVLPRNASGITAEDQFSKQMSTPEVLDENASRYKITLSTSLESNKSTIFTVKYVLPQEVYNKRKDSGTFDFSFPLFQNLNCYIEQAYVSFVFPEGAKIVSQNASAFEDYNIVRGAYQDTITLGRQGVISFDLSGVETTYEYNLLWLSFRPALWMWAIALVGCGIVLVVRRPKAPAAVVVSRAAVSFSPEVIKSFVDAYEEKRKIVAEINSLEAGMRKGKIPRRRYKVQKKNSEARISTLDRNLADLRQKLRTFGGRYSDLMHQLEVAETEINEVDKNIESIEARLRRGEISLEAHRKLLADYERRREKAETTISGILLRLREEIR